MLKTITSFFQKMFFGFVTSVSPTNFSYVPDNLEADIERELPRPVISGDDSREFKSYAKAEEYNSDLMKIFNANTECFYLDSSQKDGHFRV